VGSLLPTDEIKKLLLTCWMLNKGHFLLKYDDQLCTR
jgi:hypothetical protein